MHRDDATTHSDETTIHTDDTTQEAFTQPRGQDINALASAFCRDTTIVACLAQANAVQFVLLARRLGDAEDPALVHTLSQMSAAVAAAVAALDEALDLTWLSTIPEEQWGEAN